MQISLKIIIIKLQIMQNKYLNTTDFQFHPLIICFYQLTIWVGVNRCTKVPKRQIIDWYPFQNDLSRLHA